MPLWEKSRMLFLVVQLGASKAASYSEYPICIYEGIQAEEIGLSHYSLLAVWDEARAELLKFMTELFSLDFLDNHVCSLFQFGYGGDVWLVLQPFTNLGLTLFPLFEIFRFHD